MMICRYCGEEFKPVRKCQVTCGQHECVKAHKRYRQNKARIDARLATITARIGACEVCGKQFEKVKVTQTTCSAECRKERWKYKPKSTEEQVARKITCPACGVEFETTRHNRQYCGEPECEKERIRQLSAKNNAKQRDRKRDKTETGKRRCLKCDRWFYSPNDNRICSDCHISNSEIYDFQSSGGVLCHTLIALP